VALCRPAPPAHAHFREIIREIAYLRFSCHRLRRAVWNLPLGCAEGVTLAQRIIEMLIGRLITDEEFRGEFLTNPERTLTELSDHGLELSRTEVTALVSTDPTLWGRTADALDPRLQKASFKNVVRVP